MYKPTDGYLRIIEELKAEEESDENDKFGMMTMLGKVCDEGKRDWNFIRVSREYLVSAE